MAKLDSKPAGFKTSMLPKFLTIREVAAACRCSVMTVRRRIAQKRFGGIEFCDVFGDGRLLAREDHLAEFLSRRMKATAKEYDGSIYLYNRP